MKKQYLIIGFMLCGILIMIGAFLKLSHSELYKLFFISGSVLTVLILLLFIKTTKT